MGTALRVRRPLVRAIGPGQSDSGQAAWFIDATVIDASPAGAKPSAPGARLAWVDRVLIFIFILLSPLG